MTTHSEHFAHTLRAFVGHHQSFSVKTISDLSGVSERNIRAAMNGHFTYETAQALKHALGAEFSIRLDAPIGIVGHCRPNFFACERKLHSGVSALSATFAKYFEDGKVCHQERSALVHDHLPPLLAEANGYVRANAS